MLKETISIIMPAYNAEKTIETAINSVLKQSYKAIELIIINNGSKDKTQEIIEKYKKQTQETIEKDKSETREIIAKYKNQTQETIEKDKSETQEIIEKYKDKTTENVTIKNINLELANVSNARNVGIEQATGKYIAFLDADDEYEKNFIQNMQETIKKTNSEIATCAYKTKNSKKIWNLEKYEKIENTANIKEYLEILKENYLFNQIWNKLYITKIIKENNIKFSKDFELGEDLLFNLQYLKNINKASYINDELYIYTDGENGLNLKYRKDKFKIEYELTKNLETFYKEKKYDLNYIYNRYARVYYNGILNIYNKNNRQTKKEKDNELKKFINTEQYKKDLEFLKDKVTDKKFKIAVKYFFTKGSLPIKIFIFLNNIRRK